MSGLLFTVAGPSGVGKGTICRLLAQRLPNLALSVSCTTRAARKTEVHGVEYFFIDEQAYQQMVENDEFLEFAGVHGARYGTPRAYVREKRAQGLDVVLEIDVQGSRQVRAADPSAISIFILPPNYSVLRARLLARGTEDEQQVAMRLRNAREEMRLAHTFDYAVVNDTLELAVRQVAAIVEAERLAMRNGTGKLAEIVTTFEREEVYYVDD